MTLAIWYRLGLAVNSFAISASVSKLEGASFFKLEIATLKSELAVEIVFFKLEESWDTFVETDA